MMHKAPGYSGISPFSFAVLMMAGLMTYGPDRVEAKTPNHLPYQLGTLHGDRMVVISKHNQLTWIYQDRRLRAYDKTGNRVVDQLHVTLPKGEKAIAMLVHNEAIWLAVDKQLVKFDSNGQILTQRYFHKGIHSLSYDLKRSQLLVATPRQVFILDLNGREIERIRVSMPYIA
ncbi:MAG TPA: hypothetical protein VF268_14285 [Gammaproteobacteria bacterium]